MTLDVIMNLRPQLEEGFRGLFTQQNINAFTRQNAPENFQTVRPRVEILCRIGGATGHRFVNQVQPQQAVLQFDTFFFDIALRCVVTPQNEEQNNILIDDYVALVRGMASTFGQSTWVDTVNFPTCLIAEALRDTTTDDTMLSDDNEEFSILTFSGIVQVRTNAWTN